MSVVSQVNPVSIVFPVSAMSPVNPVSIVSVVSPVSTMSPVNPVSVAPPVNPVSAVSPVNPVADCSVSSERSVYSCHFLFSHCSLLFCVLFALHCCCAPGGTIDLPTQGDTSIQK